MMEDGDEEEDNDDRYRSMFSECDDTAMEDNEEEGGEEQAADDPVDDDVRRAISDARRDCGTDKERLQFDKMLEDHHKLLYPGCEDGQRKLSSILELLKWKAEVGFLGVYGKTKDTTEAREDQERHKGRNGNHPGQFEGPASYALTKQEKEIFFEALFSIKVPSGFSSNIKGIVNMKEKKFQNLKSHDCHVLMTQLLPVALRGLLPENVRLAIVKICAFLNAISQKVMDPETLSGLHEDVVECLVSFELLFPPSFFNIMMRLLVHLVEEIRILGPVFLHNIFPFERVMGVLKKYVHNRARPEGSISKGYGTEEVIEFCVDFLPDLKTIGVLESRNPTQEIFSELDETKAQGLIFHGAFQKTEGETEWGHEVATPPGGAAKWGGPPYGVGPSCLPRLCPFAYIFSPSRKSYYREPRYEKTYCDAVAANPISGDSGDRLRRGESSPEGSTPPCPPPD
ncbi:hypothetical protein QYE76_017991 [Lolium multiflorum]|uniref:DUF4218 domain-containing protein n=1 Tax=Lolium multiflorum TaxID=4521 RepID=A0AAD8QE04_LOLMU|nr:hypothetical protein QYE76_017991 [Lolium multiflorum]